MAGMKTHLYIYDERKLFTGDIVRKFDDPARYEISAFHIRDELIRSLNLRQNRNKCIIVVIGSGEIVEHTLSLIESIRSMRHVNGIIALCPSDKTDEIRRSAALSNEMCIPQNSNTILRIHNTVKKIFSEYTINIHRIRRNRSAVIFGIFVVLSALLLVAAMIKYPQYF